MPVKCLTEHQKDVVVQLWREYGSTAELSLVFHRSIRTIERVLTERGFGKVKKTASAVHTAPHKPLQPIPKSAQLPLFGFTPMQAFRTTNVSRGLRA